MVCLTLATENSLVFVTTNCKWMVLFTTKTSFVLIALDVNVTKVMLSPVARHWRRSETAVATSLHLALFTIMRLDVGLEKIETCRALDALKVNCK